MPTYSGTDAAEGIQGTDQADTIHGNGGDDLIIGEGGVVTNGWDHRDHGQDGWLF